MSMVEGGTLKVLLCCWIDHLAQDHWREQRARVGAYGDENAWFHGDACQH